MISDLFDQVNVLDSSLRKNRAVNVNDKTLKENFIRTAKCYFSEVRPYIVSALCESEEIVSHDQKWQELIRLAHGNNPKKSYYSKIKSIKKELTEFNVSCLSAKAQEGIHGSSLSDLTPSENLIITTLENSVPSAAASYRQGILDLRMGERLSYRGTAAEFREALRETLDHLAPDSEVKSQLGFKLEKDTSGPTMKQKVVFILKSRGRKKPQQASIKDSLDLIDGLTGDITRTIYNRGSVATHLETSRAEVQKIKRYTDTIFFDLLEISE
ncbi:MAG: hypothetical protein IH977_05640 [Nitrospinae bacterium]|nr:hypothetical protein [Nitrospinota bacterium]